MRLYESRLSYFNDKGAIYHCEPLSVHQHGGPSRPRQNCHSCIFETKENSNLRICIQYLGHHSKTTCQKSAKSMTCRVRPKFKFYRKLLLIKGIHFLRGNPKGIHQQSLILSLYDYFPLCCSCSALSFGLFSPCLIEYLFAHNDYKRALFAK